MAQAATISTLIPRVREPLVSPLNALVHNAGDKLKALQMTRIVGEADRDDANALVDDLLAIACIIDPVIKAIGEYAEFNIGTIDKSLFTDQLRGALEGNATFVICEKVAQNDEARRDELYHNGGYRQRRFA